MVQVGKSPAAHSLQSRIIIRLVATPISLRPRSVFTRRLMSLLLPVAASLLACFSLQAQEHTGNVSVASVELPDAPTPTASALRPDAGTSDAADVYNPQTTSSSSSTAAPTQNPVVPPGTMSQEQLKKQEKQRTLGVMPNFNVAYDSHVPPLSPKQKISIALHGSKDPFAFALAGIVSLYGQATDDHGPDYGVTVTNSAGMKVKVREEGYGQGWEGYGKRFGANYADSFDGNIIGNAFLPILLKEDPRYFRVGSGPIRHRVLSALESTVWCRRDSGTWGPNYANVLGNIAAGGISNLYYPSYERGIGLTFERGLVVTAENAVGASLNEFLPDVTRHFLHRDVSGRKLDAIAPVTPPTTTPQP